METNELTFGSEKYQRENGGITSKSKRSIREKFLKVLRFAETPVIINLLALLFAAVMVYKACSSTDAGLIIEKRASELQQNAKETMQFLYSLSHFLILLKN